MRGKNILYYLIMSLLQVLADDRSSTRDNTRVSHITCQQSTVWKESPRAIHMQGQVITHHKEMTR